MKISDTSGQDVVITPGSKKSKYWKAGILIAITVACVAIGKPAFDNWSRSEMTVSGERLRYAVVRAADFVRDLSVQGKVVAAVRPTIYSPAEGVVTFKAEPGEEVKKGQLIAEVESPELESLLMQETSTLDRLKIENERQQIQAKKKMLQDRKNVDLAQVVLIAAQRELRRSEDAFAFKSISQMDLEKAKDDLQSAELVFKHAQEDAALNHEDLAFEVRTMQAQVNRQELLVSNLQRQVDDLKIYSPVSGIVGNHEVEQKDQVDKNQSLMTVVDLSEFQIEIDIPESYADDLAIGMHVEIEFNSDIYDGQLTTISPEIVDNQVKGRVQFKVSLPSGLRQNQRLTTRVVLENKQDVLVVNRGQFLDSSNGRFAYVIEDNFAYRRPIVVGARGASEVEILQGLNPGEKIVISSTDMFNGANNIRITN